MGLVFLHAVGLLDELHHIGKGCLETALHGLGQHHGGDAESLGSLTRTSLLRDVAIGHHHQHGLGLALCNQVVEYLGSTSQFAPGILVTTDAMQQIEHRILLAAGLIACRGVNSESAGEPCSRTLVPCLAHGAMGHLVYFIEVGPCITTDEQHTEQVVDVADVVDIQGVNDFHSIDNHVIGIELGLQGGRGEAPHTIAVLHQVGHPRCIVSIALIFHLLSGQEVASNLHLLCLGGNQVEGDAIVGMYIGRSYLGALSPAQVLLSLCRHAREAEGNHHNKFSHCLDF